MKKAYETPSIEKIAFNYRDQVVAASGELGQATGGNGSDWFGGHLICRPVDYFGETVLGDLQLCNVRM